MATAFDITDLSEAEKIDKFFRGMKPNLQQWILVQGMPGSFAALAAKAEELDSNIYLSNQFTKKDQRGNGFNSNQKDNGPKPMELGTMNNKNNNNNSGKPANQSKEAH